MRVAPAWSLGVLAGGWSRRMGRDKATLPLGDRTLLAHQIARLAPPGVPVLVGTRADGPGRDAGVPWVEDLVPGAGPLSSLAALLRACRTPFLLAVPCDMPLLPPDLGDRLLPFAPGVEAVLLVARGRPEPLPALVSAEVALRLADLVEAGERRADAWHDRVPSACVPLDRVWPDLRAPDVLLNVNTPEDLRRAERLLAEDRSR